MYPASFIPEETMASAAARTSLSVTLPAKRFQLFQPMGGVAAKVLVCASSVEGMSKAASSKARKALSIDSPVRSGFSAQPHGKSGFHYRPLPLPGASNPAH